MSARPNHRSFTRLTHTVVALLIAITILPMLAPSVSRAADTPIYGDSLASSWTNWSWSATLNLNTSSPARDSAAIAVNYDAAWAGFYLHPDSAISTTRSSVLRFWIHGGSAGGQRVKVFVRDQAGTSSASVEIVPEAGVWKQIEISMTQLGFAGLVSGVVLQDMTGAPQPTFYLDDMALIGATPAAPPSYSRKLFLPIVSGRTKTAVPSENATPTPPTNPTPTPPVEIIPGTVRIMPLGDSITEGPSGGYRNGLWNRLTADGYKLDYVGPRYDQWTLVPDKDHAGTPGFTTGGISDNINGWMDSYKPQVVLLLIGTNDLAWWVTDRPENIAKNVGTIIDKIKAKSPSTYIVVGTITPMRGVALPNNTDRMALVDQYNVAVRSLVAERAAQGTRVALAEVNRVVTLDDLYDGVHPNNTAHDKIAEVWYNAVKPLLASP